MTPSVCRGALIARKIIISNTFTQKPTKIMNKRVVRNCPLFLYGNSGQFRRKILPPANFYAFYNGKWTFLHFWPFSCTIFSFARRLGQSKFTDLGFSVTNLHFSITDLSFFLSPPSHPLHHWDLDNFCLQFKKKILKVKKDFLPTWGLNPGPLA